MSKKYFLGTAIKITTILNIDTADTATITIKDSGDATKVSAASMIKETNRVYYYIYQTTNTAQDRDGTYTAEISITSGSYIAYTEANFEMLDPD